MSNITIFNCSDYRALCGAIAARHGDLFKEKLLGEPQSEDFLPHENIAISDEIREYIDLRTYKVGGIGNL